MSQIVFPLSLSRKIFTAQTFLPSAGETLPARVGNSTLAVCHHFIRSDSPPPPLNCSGFLGLKCVKVWISRDSNEVHRVWFGVPVTFGAISSSRVAVPQWDYRTMFLFSIWTRLNKHKMIDLAGWSGKILQLYVSMWVCCKAVVMETTNLQPLEYQNIWLPASLK